PPPVGPPQPRCRLFGWLCPLKKNGPLPSSQLPAATFPTTYQFCPTGHGHVWATPQGSGPSCETTETVKVKKPCFLQTWLHRSTCPGPGCGCCGGGGCGAHETTVTASPQGHAPSPQCDPLLKPWVLRSARTEPHDVPQ